MNSVITVPACSLMCLYPSRQVLRSFRKMCFFHPLSPMDFIPLVIRYRPNSIEHSYSADGMSTRHRGSWKLIVTEQPVGALSLECFHLELMTQSVLQVAGVSICKGPEATMAPLNDCCMVFSKRCMPETCDRWFFLNLLSSQEGNPSGEMSIEW